MADIRLTPGNDTYVEPDSDRNKWNHYFGEAGDDVIHFYQGQAIGGPGNDRIERITYPGEPWRSAFVAYWDSPAGVNVDLATGAADDGFGTRDRLVEIDHISGSSHADLLFGNAANNSFNTQGGSDAIDGRTGIDEVTLWHPASDRFRPALLGEVDIRVSPDARQATIRMLNGQFTITTTDVEILNVWDGVVQPNGNLNTVPYTIANFLTHQTMAEQAIAAGDGLRWNVAAAPGSAVTVSYSFVTNTPLSGPGAPGFRAFNAAEQQFVRDILARTAQFTNLSFGEVAESGGNVGQLRFGVSQQTETKGVSWLPNQSGAGDNAGDVWMDVDSMRDIAGGSEGYQALLHEIGHALGLRHPRNVDPGENWSVQLREADDRQVLSVMSQTPSPDGLWRADWGPLDVLALRHLYGTRTLASGDTVHRLAGAQGVAETVIIDDGGNDTIDASALAVGARLDLRSGAMSSVGVTAQGFYGVDNLGLVATSIIENAIGTPADDVLVGNALDNRLTGGAGNDWIEGGEGVDSAVFEGSRNAYEVSTGFGKVFVRARDGIGGFDTLLSIERLVFADRTTSLAASPLSADSSYRVDEDNTLAARLPDPGDVARGAVIFRLMGAPQHGSATISADGFLSYAPTRDYWGTDAIAYDISTAAGSNRYMAYVDVLPVNDGAPQARAMSALVPGSFMYRGQLPAASDVDGDTVTYSIATDTRNGDLTLSSSGAFTYRNKFGPLGTDTFSYGISDGMGGSNVYTVSLTMQSVASLIEGSDGNDVLAGRSFGDAYAGYAGNDRITGGADDDLIDGGTGIDTAVFSGLRSAYTLATTPYGWSVRSTAEGRDNLVAMERIHYADSALALDLDGNAGTVAKILGAVFGKAAVANEVYAGIGLYYIDGGMTYEALVQLAIDARLGAGASHTAIVDVLYTNVVGVPPGDADRAYFVGLLDSKAFTVAGLGVMAADIDLNVANINLVGLAQQGLEYVPYSGG